MKLLICSFTVMLIVLVTIYPVQANEWTDVSAALLAMTPENFSEALKGAEAGKRQQQIIVAEAYLSGKFVAKDYSRAAHWFLQAAEQGSTFAQNSLGYLYDKGLGVEADCRKALAWYRRAAEGGYVVAQMNTAAFYDHGLCGDIDEEEAILWYRRAAENGNLSALEMMKETAEVHYTDEPTPLLNLVEDTLTLIPLDFSETLRKDYRDIHQLTKIEYIEVRDDYWRKPAKTKKQLLDELTILEKRVRQKNISNSDLAHHFGLLVITATKVALSSNSYDPLNEQLRNSMKQFLRKGNNPIYAIVYPGWSKRSTVDLVDSLFALKNLPQDSIYPKLTKIIADLWTNIWAASGNEVNPVSVRIVRRSWQENFL